MRQSSDIAGNGTGRSLEKGGGPKLDRKVGLSAAAWYMVTENERDSRVAVVHGCFSEGGDSILSVFSWEPLRAKLQVN